MIIFFARDNQYIFLAQSVWWKASIIGSQEGLVNHIDKHKIRNDIGNLEISVAPLVHQDLLAVHPSRAAQVQTSNGDYIESDSESISTTETDIHNKVIENCETFLELSKQERQAIGRKKQQVSKVVKRRANKEKKRPKTFGTQTEGIDGSKLRRRKAAGEWQRCAWPRDRKGSHKTLDCFRWKRFEKGTTAFQK
jgi:hypothetical protein